jgi:hypothetical protein
VKIQNKCDKARKAMTNHLQAFLLIEVLATFAIRECRGQNSTVVSSVPLFPDAITACGTSMNPLLNGMSNFLPAYNNS